MVGSGEAAGSGGRGKPLKLGTYFSGGGGVDWGLRNAGLTPVWAVELEADIAAVYERNFGHSPIVADVRTIDPSELPSVDWFHASPVCTRASVANVNGEESEIDVTTAAAVSRALEALEPPFFTMENVVQYRNFQSFKNILATLEKLGYFFTTDNVNCADFGVPQTRKRLIVRASRGLLPPLPAPVRWIGWYEAIEDSIPALPETKLAPWQIKRLPEGINANEGFLVCGIINSSPMAVTVRAKDQPAFTVTTQIDQRDIKAALPGGYKVVSITPRALARFQSVPDQYWLPEKRGLAAKVIGNMVPPLLMQRIAEGMLA